MKINGRVIFVVGVIGLAIAFGQIGPVVQAQERQVLAEKGKCLTCHTIEKDDLGPAWQKVANQYRGEKIVSVTLANGSVLVGTPLQVLQKKISQGGGKDHLGNKHPPIPANVSEHEVERLAELVLALAKK